MFTDQREDVVFYNKMTKIPAYVTNQSNINCNLSIINMLILSCIKIHISLNKSDLEYFT